MGEIAGWAFLEKKKKVWKQESQAWKYIYKLGIIILSFYMEKNVLRNTKIIDNIKSIYVIFYV